jgi:Helix-turn-helix domain
MVPGDEGDQPAPGARQIRLRALAHPLRWRLLDLIAVEGSVTATRCAELTGESVASCSYHLGILRKYGYLEPVPDVPGREKPWRATTLLVDDMSVFAKAKPPEDVGDGVGVAVAETFIDHQVDLMKARLRLGPQEPEDWTAASVMGGALMYVTTAELSQVKDDLVAVLSRFADRAEDPSSRPPGALAARVFVTAYPDPVEN